MFQHEKHLVGWELKCTVEGTCEAGVSNDHEHEGVISGADTPSWLQEEKVFKLFFGFFFFIFVLLVYRLD